MKVVIEEAVECIANAAWWSKLSNNDLTLFPTSEVLLEKGDYSIVIVGDDVEVQRGDALQFELALAELINIGRTDLVLFVRDECKRVSV
ncbi:MAG: hypothetical protein AB1916_04830 [Thermodesulfobacteriota bacterium]